MKKMIFMMSLVIGLGIFASQPMTAKASSDPSITAITPNTTSVGSLITISGENFGEDCEYENGGYGGDCEMSVIFEGGENVRFSDGDDNDRDWTETSIAVLVPLGAQSGKIKVHYVFNNFTEDKNDDVSFDLIGPKLTILSAEELPSITSMSPVHAMIGDMVRVRGKNFGPTCESARDYCAMSVNIGSVKVNFSSVSFDPNADLWADDQIAFKIPTKAKTDNVSVSFNFQGQTMAADGSTLTLHAIRASATRAQEMVDIYNEASAFVPSPSATTSFKSLTSALSLNLKRDLVKEAAAEKLLDKIFGNFDATSHLGNSPIKYSFIFYAAYDIGTTSGIGMSERVGVLNSWRSAYDKDYPTTDSEWIDLLKLANGRFPGGQSLTAESEAGIRFQQIYKRAANRSNVKDNAAMMFLAYGMRPKTRNLKSEYQAAQIFKSIFGSTPKSALDWDAVRAVAYSGAKR